VSQGRRSDPFLEIVGLTQSCLLGKAGAMPRVKLAEKRASGQAQIGQIAKPTPEPRCRFDRVCIVAARIVIGKLRNAGFAIWTAVS
jgi:hypothetical protein